MLLPSGQEEHMDKNRRDTIFIAAYLAITVLVGAIVWALSDYTSDPGASHTDENAQRKDITPAQ
jgi:hypothetical protein